LPALAACFTVKVAGLEALSQSTTACTFAFDRASSAIGKCDELARALVARLRHRGGGMSASVSALADLNPSHVVPHPRGCDPLKNACFSFLQQRHNAKFIYLTRV
jgi:hypothetical protein